MPAKTANGKKKNNGNVVCKSTTDGGEVSKECVCVCHGEGEKLYLLYYTVISNLTSGLIPIKVHSPAS